MSWLNSLYRRLNNHPYQTLALLFGVCVAVYVVTIPLPRSDGMLIGSDGIAYYMYVRSLVFDHDLSFADEYARLYPDIDVTSLRTATGLTSNQYAIGPGILWAPFFVVGHLVAMGLRQVGFPVGVDGYSYPYQAAVCLGSMVYGFFGIVLIYQTIKRFYPRTALAASLLIWLATNVIYYLLAEPSMAHMCSLFAVALLVNVWVSSRPEFSMRNCFVIGLAGGLVGIVRQPDATLLALPVVDCLLGRGGVLPRVKRIAAVVVGFALIFWIQMMAWQVLNGNPLSSGYFRDSTQRFFWLSPHLVEVLFSTEHGLFLWHPILLFAVAGLFYLGQSQPRLAVLFGAGILLQAYLIAAWWWWSQAYSFGGRMFIASLPMFAVGLAAVLQWALEQGASLLCWVTGLGLVFWNALFFLQYRLGYISHGGPYTLRQLTVGKLEMLLDLARRAVRLLAR